nr:hypothetical protein [Tanacetum cinerariifolium]
MIKVECMDDISVK